MEFILSHFELIAGAVTTILGYIFGRWHHLFLERRSRTLDRFEKLYAPFEKMIWIQTHGAFRFSDLDSKLQRQFFELLFNNYEYASSELKELLYCFKSSYDSIPEFGVEDSDRIFFEIENNISEGFNALSKTLFLEPYCLKKSKKVLKRLSKSL